MAPEGTPTTGVRTFLAFARTLGCIFVLFLSFGCSVASPVSPVATEQRPPALLDSDWSDEVLYFVIVDRFANGDRGNDANVNTAAAGTFHGGDLRGLREQLDEIASLGVTAIWITPVVKNIPGFVTGAGFPDWGYHGYWADDFYALDARFGDEADLAALADECHRRGIKLLLDVVYNHAGYNSQYITNPRTASWLRSNERGGCGTNDLVSCVAGLPDFKTELPEVADYLMDAHLGLAKRVRLDGFRLDTVKHVDHPFWTEHRARVDAELGKDFFLLGEVWGGDPEVLDPWFSRDELDGGFDFAFQGNVIAFVQGRGRTIAFDRYLSSREKTRSGYLLSHFLSSHDVTGALSQLEGNRDLFRLAAILQFTTGGIPMIYYGEEVGRAGGAWPQNRSDMPWGSRSIEPGAGDSRDEELRDDYRKLISIRRAHPSLSRGKHEKISADGDLLVFRRRDAATGEVVIVAVNRGSEPAIATFAIPAEWSGREVVDAWRGGSLERDEATFRIVVPARDARIITPKSQS